MGSKICANNVCPHNNHTACSSAAECPGYREPNCTGCLQEYTCNWHPEECNFKPDPYEQVEGEKLRKYKGLGVAFGKIPEDAEIEKKDTCIRDCKNCWKTKLVNPQSDISGKWIPIPEILSEDELERNMPGDGEHVLLSFSNADYLDVGRYEEDEEGGAFYPRGGNISYVGHGMFVNAWMPLPGLYKTE